jgi:hypothetical protein
MNVFEIGESVSLLNETGTFVVRKILDNKVVIEDEFGFDRIIDIQFLVKKRPINVEKVIIKDFSPTNTSIKPSNVRLPEIDLHIENLVSDNILMTPHQKFTLQMNRFKQFTNEMISKKVTKFRVIHGRGEGKLKSEISLLIDFRIGFTMHDDNYFQGRVGASIIEMQITKVTPFDC